MRRTPLKLLIVVTAVAVAAGACGSDKNSNAGSSGSTGASKSNSTTTAPNTSAGMSGMKMGTEAPASTLRATLTAALQEHVYLAGITTGTALAGQDYKPAAAALEKNTQALQDAVSSVYGDAGGKQFGDLWRKHIGFFVDYTTAKATGDAAKAAKAKSDLDGYRADFGAFIESATKGGLTKQAVADALKGHVDSLLAAIDAQAAKDPNATAKLSAAASEMPMTAATLAGAIAKQYPSKFGG
ncbi:MAG: hypothetical protein HYX34_01930 [Actinobacteria bacterium]|nr:hypothetical protein [Actinomycetota bacterium]